MKIFLFRQLIPQLDLTKFTQSCSAPIRKQSSSHTDLSEISNGIVGEKNNTKHDCPLSNLFIAWCIFAVCCLLFQLTKSFVYQVHLIGNVPLIGEKSLWSSLQANANKLTSRICVKNVSNKVGCRLGRHHFWCTIFKVKPFKNYTLTERDYILMKFVENCSGRHEMLNRGYQHA